MSEQFFADGLTEVSVVAGVVRIEWGVLRRSEANPKGALAGTVALNIPVEGFAQAMGALQQLMEKLIKDGVLKQRTGTAGPPSSPNFN